MMNCGKISSNLTLAKCDRYAVGIVPDVILINKDDISSFQKSDGVISAINMKDSAVAYRYETYRNSVEASSTMSEGTYAARFTHEVSFRVFTKAQKIKRQLNAMANGRFVAIVKNISDDVAEVKYEVYGLENGLIMTECEAASNNAEGVVYSVVLASDKDAEENEIPLSYWAGSVEATESGIASLLGLYIDVTVQGNGAAPVTFINQSSALYANVTAIRIGKTLIAKEYFYTFNDIDTHTVRIFLSSVPTSLATAFSGSAIRAIDFYNMQDVKVNNMSQMFYNCRSLQSVDLSSLHLTEGGYFNQTFQGCFNLTSVKLPAEIEDIGYRAFDGCTSLTSITIPESVKAVGSYAFNNCAGSLYINSNTIASESYPTWEQRPTAGSGWLSNAKFTKLIFGSAIESIGDFAFVSWGTITEIDFTNAVNLHTIGNEVFGGSNITTLSLPQAVKYIGRQAFENCLSLEELLVSDSLLSIGESAFRYCNKLREFAIPYSVETISMQAFRGCGALQSIKFGAGLTTISWSSFSLLGHQDADAMYRDVSIGSGVKTIEGYAFEGSKINPLNIPSNVKEIDFRAFAAATVTSLRFDGSTIAITGGGTLLGDIGTIYVPLEHISNYRNIPQLNGFNIVGY